MGGKLIVNADDFGLTKSVNKGIIEAHVNGILTSTTFMVNTPGFEDAVQLSRQYPSLGVGFHFNLTYGVPLLDPSEIPSLVGHTGYFHPISLKALLSWKQEDVRKELAAQWEKAKTANISITHIDSHHYIQSHPFIRAEMIRLAEDENLPMRLCLRARSLLRSCMIACSQEKEGSYPVHTDRFIADTYFSKRGLSQFIAHLESIGDEIVELNCHPGYVDEELRALSKWTDKREREISILTSGVVKKVIQTNKLRLIRYDQLNKIEC